MEAVLGFLSKYDFIFSFFFLCNKLRPYIVHTSFIFSGLVGICSTHTQIPITIESALNLAIGRILYPQNRSSIHLIDVCRGRQFSGHNHMLKRGSSRLVKENGCYFFVYSIASSAVETQYHVIHTSAASSE